MADVLTDEEIIGFTQGTRKRFLEKLLENGFPTDPKDQATMLTTMADMDRAALGRMRIGAADKNANVDQQAAMAVARIIQQFGVNCPYEAPVAVQGRKPELLPHLLPPANAAPGETDVGIAFTNYDEFITAMENPTTIGSPV